MGRKTTPRAEKEFKSLFDKIINPRDTEKDTDIQDFSIEKPSKFNKKLADKITNFNPSTDTLEIDTDSFGIDGSATFAAGKNKKAVRKNLSSRNSTFSTTRRRAGSTSTRMAQTKALVMVASLPSLKELLS